MCRNSESCILLSSQFSIVLLLRVLTGFISGFATTTVLLVCLTVSVIACCIRKFCLKRKVKQNGNGHDKQKKKKDNGHGKGEDRPIRRGNLLVDNASSLMEAGSEIELLESDIEVVVNRVEDVPVERGFWYRLISCRRSTPKKVVEAETPV